MKVDMLIERIAEAMDKTDGAETGILGCVRAALDQFLPDHPQQDMQNGTHRDRIGLEEVAQAFWQLQHPLAGR